ncbi:MAG: putative RNA uridine N3 methyltransferase [Nitrososphaerota archaeon]|nr:putative RNA uridine N3 methyltransferase [Nitrososphaerota archaeon]
MPFEHSKLSIAIPDSLVSEEKDLREKTVKIGMVGRACAIFKVHKIYIYKDHGNYERDFQIIKSLLEYMETPQYLRKKLFTKKEELRFVGILPPLRTPHHKLLKPLSEVKVGEFREGLVVRVKDRLMVDVGLSSLIPLNGSINEGSRVTVRFTQPYPNLRCEIVDRSVIDEYWGYVVERGPILSKLVKNVKSELFIVTSREGRLINELWDEFVKEVKKAKKILIAFGSPRKGIHEILAEEGCTPENFTRFIINMFPKQGTETIRTEEAILGTLALINLALHM